MTTEHNGTWSILSDYYSPQDWEKAFASISEEEYHHESTVGKVWSRHKTLSKFPQEDFIHDHASRKILGHLNSIKNTDQFKYEGALQGSMFTQWKMAISSLPKEVVEDTIGRAQYEALTTGFTPPSSALKSIGSPDLFSKDYRYNHDELSSLSQKIQRGELVILPSGHTQHAVALVFCKGYLLICNRGDHLLENMKSRGIPLIQPKTIQAFKIDTSRVTSDILEAVQDTAFDDRKVAFHFLYNELPTSMTLRRDLICEKIETLSTGWQKTGNCTSACCKEALMRSMALLSMQQSTEGTFSLTEEDLIRAKQIKKIISAHARAINLESYYQRHLSQGSGSLTNSHTFDWHLAEQCQKKTIKHLKKAGLELTAYPHINQIEKERMRKKEENHPVAKAHRAFSNFFKFFPPSSPAKQTK